MPLPLPGLTTVMIVRKDYGRRYSDLPVDQLDNDGFEINCAGSYMRPHHYDLRPGDLVRWRQGNDYLEAVISAVAVDEQSIRVILNQPRPLPADFFPY